MIIFGPGSRVPDGLDLQVLHYMQVAGPVPQCDVRGDSDIHRAPPRIPIPLPELGSLSLTCEACPPLTPSDRGTLASVRVGFYSCDESH